LNIGSLEDWAEVVDSRSYLIRKTVKGRELNSKFLIGGGSGRWAGAETAGEGRKNYVSPGGGKIPD